MAFNALHGDEAALDEAVLDYVERSAPSAVLCLFILICAYVLTRASMHASAQLSGQANGRDAANGLNSTTLRCNVAGDKVAPGGDMSCGNIAAPHCTSRAFRLYL